MYSGQNAAHQFSWFDFGKEGTRQKCFARSKVSGVFFIAAVVLVFDIASGLEEEAVHSLHLMLLHVGWDTFPVGQVGGVCSLAPQRLNLVPIRFRQMMFAILDFVEQCQLVLWVVFFENFADRLVDLVVHFQDVRLGDRAFLARRYHFQHAVQLCLVQQIFLRILLGCLAHVPLVKLRSFRLLVVLQYEVRTCAGQLDYSGCATDG